jgi:ferredoxin
VIPDLNFQEEKTMAHVISDECIACGACQPTCPVDAISEGDIYTIDAETCTDCGACVDSCPVDAISQA